MKRDRRPIPRRPVASPELQRRGMSVPLRRTPRTSDYEPSYVERYLMWKLYKFIIIFIISFVVGGVGLLITGIKEAAKPTYAEVDSHRITLEELARNGPGENGHIELTDFSAALHFAPELARPGEPGLWHEVWIPLLVRGGAYDVAAEAGDTLPVGNFSVIMRTASAIREDELEDLLARTSLRGVVTNQLEPLSAGKRAFLAEMFPDTKTDQCWIFEEGRVPKERSLVMLWLGLLFTTASVGGAGYVWLSSRKTALIRAAADASRLKRLGRARSKSAGSRGSG